MHHTESANDQEVEQDSAGLKQKFDQTPDLQKKFF